MVAATEKLDVVVALVKMEIQIATALRAFQIATKGAGLLRDGRPSAPGGLQALYLFPSHTVNDGLMDIEEDRPVFLRVFNPTLHLVGLRVGFEVDHIAAVFLQGEDFLDGGVVPLGRLQRAFGAALAEPLAGSIGRGVQRPHRPQRRGDLQGAVALQGQTVDAAHHLGCLRVFHVAIRRRRKRNPCVSFHLIDDPALLGNVLGVVLIHDVLERGEIVLALVAVHAIGHSYQPHIMEREKFLGELANLNVVPAQPGEVFHKHRRDVPGLDCGNHFLKAGALHGSAGDTVIHEKDGIGITLVFGGLLENFLLVLDAVGLAVHIIITAQSAVEGGCASRDFLA